MLIRLCFVNHNVILLFFSNITFMEVEANERLREALEDIASSGYAHLEMLNIAQQALDDYEE
ncbi:hypothetical protein ACIQXG_05020 [Lysinibacillus sphaericus]|uniref:hypothetical protein n=1 Tax=Lysinibacillus sphaericus TaxID=1421 RepID=UPI0038092694